MDVSDDLLSLEPWPYQDTDSFIMAKKMKESPPSLHDDINDDATAIPNSNIAGEHLSHLYASIMVALQVDGEASQSEAPIECIRRINEMFLPLTNKFHNKVWFAPWQLEDHQITQQVLRTTLQDRCTANLLNLSEKYIHDFNRFISWGRRSYVRVHILYHPSLTEAQLLAQMDLCKIKGNHGQFFQKAHSTSKDPLSAGTLTGSVQAMIDSPDFFDTFKQKWNLSHLGLYWGFPRSKLGGAYTMKKNVLHIEIDRSDHEKIEHIRTFFNQKSTSVTQQFWGTPMQWVPQWDYRLDDEVGDRIERNKETQYKIGMSLKSCTIIGANLFNLTQGNPKKTLHRTLMEIESIHDKYIALHSDPTSTQQRKSFKGRLFYAIIPTSSSNKVTFYYTSANSEEARSVARALPRYISSNLKLDPASFCTRSFIHESRDGQWNATTRQYKSEEDLIEQKKLDTMDSSMMAIKEIYIDPAHERALAHDGDSVTSTIDTRLTKGDEVAPPVRPTPSDSSTLTGATRESKVQRAVQEVHQQHLSTINTLQDQIKALTAVFQGSGLTIPQALRPTDHTGKQSHNKNSQNNLGELEDSDDSDTEDGPRDDSNRNPPTSDSDDDASKDSSSVRNPNAHPEDTMENSWASSVSATEKSTTTTSPPPIVHIQDSSSDDAEFEDDDDTSRQEEQPQKNRRLTSTIKSKKSPSGRAMGGTSP